MINRGPWRGRADPNSPKSNPHWAKMYAAIRRAKDIAILQECERQIAAEEEAAKAPGKPAEPPITFSGPSPQAARQAALTRLSEAFGRPFKERPRK